MMKQWFRFPVLLRARVAAPHTVLRYGQLLNATAHAPLWLHTVRALSSDSGSSIKKEKVTVHLREEDLVESFVKGWGKGGQKINKVRNCVLLKHVPTGLHVRCQETRSLDGNRKIARKLLFQKLDDQVNGELSKRSVKIGKLRKKKANRKNKSKQKYAAAAAAGVDQSDEGDEEEEEDDEYDDSEEEEGPEKEERSEDEEDQEEDEDAIEIVDFDVDAHAFRAKRKTE